MEEKGRAASGGGFNSETASKIAERLAKFKVGFLEQIDPNDYLITDPWIYYCVVIHAYFDSLEGIKWNGFLEEDPDLIEDKTDEGIPLNTHTDKWMSEDKDVVSFRYEKYLELFKYLTFYRHFRYNILLVLN